MKGFANKTQNKIIFITASTPEPLLPKVKEQSYLSKVPDREERESQGERVPLFGEKEGDQSGSIERKEWTPH